MFPGAGFNAYVFRFGCLNAKGEMETMLELSQMMRAREAFRIWLS
jgi:hypothetical protein